MPLDPTKHPDWQIAEAAEAKMKTVYQLGDELGLEKQELLPHGHHIAKVDFKTVLERLAGSPDGKYIDVTAITPTPLGEGKSTSTMGLTPHTRGGHVSSRGVNSIPCSSREAHHSAAAIILEFWSKSAGA